MFDMQIIMIWQQFRKSKYVLIQCIIEKFYIILQREIISYEMQYIIKYQSVLKYNLLSI